MFCWDASNVPDEFAEYCKRRPKRPLALGDDILSETPRKKRCAVDVITQSPSKSACAVGNVIRKKRRALDARSGQDKLKAAIGDERAVSCKPKKQRQQQRRSCHTPCHAMSYHVMLCHAMPCRAIPCNAMLCHAMLYHAMSCHAMPCCAIRDSYSHCDSSSV